VSPFQLLALAFALGLSIATRIGPVPLGFGHDADNGFRFRCLSSQSMYADRAGSSVFFFGFIQPLGERS
jgi:hypothetical protein